MSNSRKTIRAKRNFLLKLVLVGVIVGVAATLFNWFTYDRNWVTTDNAFVVGNIIPVQSDATGVVAQVLAEETQMVKKGDALVRLDAQRAGAALEQAEAELGRAVRNVAALFASRRQTCQKIIARVAIRDRALHDLARYRQASASGAAPRQLLQNTEDQLAAQEADVREARAEFQAVEARIGGVAPLDHPDIQAAKARYDDAYLEFLRQNIRAPASGYVAKRRVQVGQRVRPGDHIMNIVPLDHLWIEANLWENRMGKVRPGQPAIIKTDLYGSGEIYHGVVEGLVPGSGSVFATLPPDNATGNFIRIVQRVPIRISIDENELKHKPLRPGLSTVTSIDISAAGGKQGTRPVAMTAMSEYSTEVFDRDLAEAKSRADEIVRKNIMGGLDGADSRCKAANDANERF